MAATVLGVHETRLHVPARLGGDPFLLKAAGRKRPREADWFPGNELFEALLIALEQIDDDLLGVRLAARRESRKSMCTT